MDSLKQWAFAVCCAMVACGIAQLLLPKANMEKMFKLCVSVFFLCCLLSPVVLQHPSLRLEFEEYSLEEIERRADKLTAVVEQQSEGAMRDGLAKIVEGKLAEKGINYSSVTIHINTNGQNSAEQLSAEIVLADEHRQQHDQLRRELRNDLGMEVRLGYE